VYNYIFTLQGGHDTNTYYVELLRRTDGYMWDTVAAALAAAPTWATNVALAVTESNGSGHFGWSLPSGLPVGFYRASLRLRAGANPAATDDVKDVLDFQYAGGDPVL
jgi:hypothetical protein